MSGQKSSLYSTFTTELLISSFLLRCRLSFSAKKFFSAQASMASVSATLVRFPSSLKQSFGSNLVTGRTSIVKLASLGLAKGFPSLRSSSFRVSCSAKPETITRVCGVVRKQLSLPAESEVTPETKFSGLGADSLDLVEIVMSLEEEFGIIVEEEDSQNITTVQEAADLIEDLMQKKGNA